MNVVKAVKTPLVHISVVVLVDSLWTLTESFAMVNRYGNTSASKVHAKCYFFYL